VKKYKISSIIAFAVVFVLAGTIAVYAVVRVATAPKDESTSAGVTSARTFDVIQSQDANFTTETVNVNVHGDEWGSSQFSSPFSNQDEIDAAARAQAERNARSLALSQAVRNSYGAAAAQGSPDGIPTSAAPLAPDNRYSAGYCTWYAYNRRYQMGRPIPNMLGNGGSWHFNAGRYGLGADHTPEVGAVFEESGHVAVVEAVGENNTVFISEMNYAGLYSYRTRWVSNASAYWYIH
jgi:surface antigen